MVVLGIESSCDETSAAVVCSGSKVLSNVVNTQIALHSPYGGVVPEIASRSHLEKVSGVVELAMHNAFTSSEAEASCSSNAAWWHKIDGVAVTYGPGLASSLIVGLSFAKGLALRLNKPLIGVNHIEAHIHSVFLGCEPECDADLYPMLALVVSGGHTSWFEVGKFAEYKLIGQTLDDAAGEAFDKAAKLLGLGYPGGPLIEQVASEAVEYDKQLFSQGRVRPGNPVLGKLDARMCVSFSGLKTALMYYLRNSPADTPSAIAQVAAAYQSAIVTTLAERSQRALNTGKYRTFAVGGGVSLNNPLRRKLQEVAQTTGARLLLAEPQFCGDNAAMIAGLASAGGGVSGEAALRLDVVPSLRAGL